MVSITGHVREGTFEETYAHELNYDEKLRLLSGMPLPPLDLPAYERGQYDVYYKRFLRIVRPESVGKRKRKVMALDRKTPSMMWRSCIRQHVTANRLGTQMLRERNRPIR